MALARVNVSSGGRARTTLSVPTQSGTLTYSGAAQSPVWNGYDPAQLSISGTTSATNAGTYTATFTPQGRCVWADGTSNPRNVTWTIAKANGSVTLSATSGTVTYGTPATFRVTNNASGGALSVTSASTTYATATISGTTVTVNCVQYRTATTTITVTSAATANYNAATATYTMTAAKAATNLSASISGAITYGSTGTITVSGNAGGGTLSATSSNTNVATVTVSGNTVTVTSTGVGNATITVTAAATTNHAAGSTTCAVTVSRATPTLTLSRTSATIPYGETATFTVNASSGGTLSVTSASTTYATVSLDGTTVTVTCRKYRDTPVDITVRTAATTEYAAATATFTMTPAKASISLSASISGAITYGETGTITVTGNTGGGAITATSSNTSYVTVQNTTTNSVTVKCVGYSSSARTITIAVAETANYAAGSTTCSVSTARAILEVPTVTNTEFTYDGNNHAPTIGAYDSELITVTNTARTDAGSYNVVFKLASTTNCQWSDNTTSQKTVAWSIEKAACTLTLSATSGTVGLGDTKTFTVTTPSNGALSVASSNTSVATASISGSTVTVTSTGAGNATITVTAAATTNYNAATATYTITISKTAPTLTLSETSGTATADNGRLTFTVTSNSNGTITVSSSDATIASAAKSGNTVTVTCKKAGSATITVSQAETTTYAAASKTYAVTVNRATPTLTLSSTTGSAVKGKTVTFNITTPSTGALSVTSSDTSIATATISGKTVTVTGVGLGSATITVSLAASDVYTAKTASYSATITAFTIITDSWSTISSRAQAGTAANYYKVGDCKEVTLNGKIGDYLELNNERLYVYILHINYPMNGTPDNNIIWGGFKTADGADVALVDSMYQDSIFAPPPTSGTICFNMNHTWQDTEIPGNGYGGTNYGGWKGTDLRYDILGATSQAPSQYNQLKSTSNVGYNATAATLTNPKANTLLAALPADFRNVLRLWSRWIDAKGYNSSVEANIEETIDAVSLLTEFEVQGAQSYANQYEQNHQTQMDYYKNGNRQEKNKHSSPTSPNSIYWQLASPHYQAFASFCTVKIGGGIGSANASISHALAPAFKT